MKKTATRTNAREGSKAAASTQPGHNDTRRAHTCDNRFSPRAAALATRIVDNDRHDDGDRDGKTTIIVMDRGVKTKAIVA